MQGLGRSFQIPRLLNELKYTVSQPEVIEPTSGAFPVFAYQGVNHSAGIAYSGNYKTLIMGFPFESIDTAKNRANIMASILHFLMKL